jgi:2,5-furandicarboxylate decarboxylase 1
VFQTILSGTEVHNSVGLLGEANVLDLLQLQVPGVKDVYFSHGGCGFYGAIVQLAQTRAGWGKQAIMAAFGAFPPLKVVTVVDDDVDIRDPSDVEWAMATRLDPSKGVVVLEDIFGHGLNPSFPDYLGSKVGFDATQPYPFRPEFERVTVADVSLDAHDVVIPEAVKTPSRPPGAGPTLVEYILEKVGAAPAAQEAPAASSPPAPPPSGGPSLVDYILEKTAGKGNGAAPSAAINGNGATEPAADASAHHGPVPEKTNGGARPDA